MKRHKPRENPRGFNAPFFLSVLLFAIVASVFLPILKNGFINYDDPIYVTQNVQVNDGLTWKNLGWAFYGTDGGIWLPLTWFSHMLDCQIYGLKPWGHHLTSVLLHATNAVLVFLLFHRLTGATWRSFVLAALFGLHPLRVESVAWVAERKDVLSTTFGVAALLAYVGYTRKIREKSPSTKNYLWALILFALGLMAKPMLVTLPFIFLLLDYWPLKRLESKKDIRPLLVEKWPFFVIMFLASIVAVIAQKHEHAVVNLNHLPFSDRIENAAVSYARYIGKLFWPENLAIYYPRPDHWPLPVVLSAAAILFAISVLFIWQRTRRPYLLVGWLWFLGTLVPVIGLLQVGQQAMADRYTYIPQIGLLLCLVWGACEWTNALKQQTFIRTAMATASILACASLTYHEIGWWHDSETLFKHALAVTDKNVVAHNNLGDALLEKKQFDDAIIQYRQSIEIEPNAANYLSLGDAFSAQGQLDEAIIQFQNALTVNSNYALAHFNLANSLLQKGRTDDAIIHYKKTLELKPDYADAHINLGNALMKLGRADDAEFQYQKALEINPREAKAQSNLASVLLQKGQIAEAINHYEEALKIEPDFVAACNNLAWIYATNPDPAVRNGNKAVELAEHASQLTGGQDLNILSTLAAAYAEAGRYSEAVTTAQRASEIAKSQNDIPRENSIQSQLNFYLVNRPFHAAKNN